MRVVLLLCSFAIFSVLANSASAERRYALIISNQTYPDEIGSLAKTHSDGQTMSQALREVGFEVAWVKDANKSTMLEAIAGYVEQLAKAGPDAVGFFYYSGHGAAASKFGENFLIPTQAPIRNLAQLPLLGLRLGEVIDAIEASGAGVNFVVVDACRNVPFVRTTKALQSGLKPVRERGGMVIAFATEPGNVAFDENIYSRALSAELQKPGQDAIQMFRAVRRVVFAETGDHQFPWVRDGLVQDFYFLGPAGGAKPPPVPNAMLQDWNTIKDTNDAARLEGFERRYPGSLLAAEAYRRRMTLLHPDKPAVRHRKDIHLWIAGDPHEGGMPTNAHLPADLHLRAKALGYTFEVTKLTARDFPGRLFKAIDDGEEPDIISVDNYGLLDPGGIETPKGRFTGIRSNPKIAERLIMVNEVLRPIQNGWQLLISASPNHEQARALIEDAVVCEDIDNLPPVKLTRDDIVELRRNVELAVTAYASCSQPSGAVLDDEALGGKCIDWDLSEKPYRLKSVEVCSSFGNRQLAMSTALVSVERKGELGRQSIFVVHRKDDAWRALVVSNDPTIRDGFRPDMFALVKKRMSASRSGQASLAAQIITPDGQFPEPATGERFGEFVWRASPSKQIVGELAEFDYGWGSRFFLKSPVTPKGEQRVSTGMLWSGQGMPWKWRIWSIARDGTLTFSNANRFSH